MKKRIITALLLLVLAVFLITPAAAANTKNYTLDTIDISIDLPSNWTVITQTDAREKDCQEYLNMTAKDIKQYFIDNYIHLFVVEKDYKYSIFIKAFPSENDEYNSLSDAELDEAAEAYKYICIDDNETCTGYSTYKQGETSFVAVDYYDTDGDYYRDYFTVYKGQMIFLVATSNCGEFNEEFDQICKQAIDSISFVPADETDRFPVMYIIVIAAVAVPILVGVTYIILKARKKKNLNSETAETITAEYAPSLQSTIAQPTPELPLTKPAAPVKASPAQNCSTAKLAQLKELLDSGLITQVEFDTKKAEILKDF